MSSAFKYVGKNRVCRHHLVDKGSSRRHDYIQVGWLLDKINHNAGEIVRFEVRASKEPTS